jgi:hypothetical protein
MIAGWLNRLQLGAAPPVAPATIWTPASIVGGALPHVPGQEVEQVWHAAVEACASEQLHMVWRVLDGTLYWIAAPSRDFAGRSGSWTPFAALLPGSDQAPDGAYLATIDVETGGTTPLMVALIVDGEGGLDILCAPPSQLKPQLTRTHPRLEPFDVTVPEGLIPVPWHIMALAEEQAFRRGALWLAAALAVADIVLATVVVVALMGVGLQRIETVSARKALKTSSANLGTQLAQATTDEVGVAIARLVQLEQDVRRLGGFLASFRAGTPTGNAPEWQAIFPPGITASAIEELGGHTEERLSDDRVVVRQR